MLRHAAGRELAITEEMLMAGWESFFAAEAGASAALSGLVFVAVSINLTRILEIPHLPERAAEALMILFSVLAVATFGLVPGQRQSTFGAEVLGAGACVSLFTIVLQLRAFRNDSARRWLAMRSVLAHAACIPFIVAGGLLLAGRADGVYWILPGTLASFAAGALNAWVLLVEIQR
jgi:hypothetical protein